MGGRMIPARSTKVSVAAPLPVPLRELKPDDLDVVQLVMSYGNVGDVMDKSESFDLEVAQCIVDLIKRKILIVLGGSRRRRTQPPPARPEGVLLCPGTSTPTGREEPTKQNGERLSSLPVSFAARRVG